MFIRLGITPTEAFWVTVDDLLNHMVIFGASGSGKSKLLELLIRQLIQHDVPFALIDPKNHLFDDMVAWMSKENISPFQKREILLLDDGFSLDPLWISGEFNERKGDTKIQWTKKAVVRLDRSHDFSKQPRKERVTENIFWSVAVPRWSKGRKRGPARFYRSLSHAQLIGSRPWEERIFPEIRPNLPKHIADDLQWLHYLTPRDRAFELSSSITGLRGILTTGTIPIFASKKPPLDFEEIVETGKSIMCRFGERDGFSQEVGYVLGHMIFAGLFQAARIVQPDKPYIVIVDESDEILGPDTSDALKRARGFNMSIILCVQSPGALEEDER